MTITRRKMLGGIATVGAITVAGCNDSSGPTAPENFRFHTKVSSETNGDTLIVNVEGRMTVVTSDCLERVDAIVELFIDGEKVAEKTIEVPETEKGTEWGVTFPVEHTTGEVSVEVEPVDTHCP